MIDQYPMLHQALSHAPQMRLPDGRAKCRCQHHRCGTVLRVGQQANCILITEEEENYENHGNHGKQSAYIDKEIRVLNAHSLSIEYLWLDRTLAGLCVVHKRLI
jgi:hypothetical protein